MAGHLFGGGSCDRSRTHGGASVWELALVAGLIAIVIISSVTALTASTNTTFTPADEYQPRL